MTGFLLKLKSKSGQHVVSNLNPDTTIGVLKAKISEITQIPQDVLHILIGFPPKPIDLSKNDNKLKSSGISNGDTLIIEEKQKSKNTTSSSTLTTQHDTMVQNILDDEQYARQLAAEEELLENTRLQSISEHNQQQQQLEHEDENAEFMGILLKKVVPADNSCLFTSIGYVLNGQVDTDVGIIMRNIIAEHVSSDPETYTEAFLGKPNREYCDWIRRIDSWGGAIEVSILSSFYGIEIDVVDITNAIINRFGEDKNYGQRVFLLFDGIHYDPLYMESLTVSF